MSYFQQNIHLLRKSKSMTQSDAAELFETNTDTWSKWEKHRDPKYDKLIEIAAYFNVNIHDLLTKDFSAVEIQYFPFFQELPAGRSGLLSEPSEKYISEEGASPPVNVEDWAALAARLLYLEGEVAKLRQRVKELEGKM